MNPKACLVWNETEQLYASPDSFGTEAEAQAFADAFRARYARQGYYLTADGFRIAPEQIELVIVPEEEPTGPR